MKSANGRVVPDIDVLDLKSQYNSGVSTVSLGKQYGCSRNYIQKLLEGNNIPVRKQVEAARRAILKNPDAARYPTQEELHKLYVDEHYSYNAIAKMYNVSYSTIHRLRQRYGIPSVSNVEAWKNRRPDVDAKWRENLSKAGKGKVNSKDAREKLSRTRVQRLASGEIINSHHFFKTGYATTVKAGNQFYDSSYEQRMFELLDLCDEVVSWTKRHGIIIPYKGKNGLTKNHIPDFLVHWSDGITALYEVKPKPMVDYKNNPLKICAAAKFADEHGFLYSVVTEENLGLETEIRKLPEWVSSYCTDTHLHLLNPVPASVSC